MTAPIRTKPLTRRCTRSVSRLAVGAAVHGSVPGHRWHPDTANYLTRVETADGQSLEPAIVEAWDAFFRAMDDPDHPTPTAATHKIALAAGTMIPMLGARTLAGALIPAYAGMPTPTNVGFVTGDYDRATGLKGDGVGKYINMGGVLNAVPDSDVSLFCVADDTTSSSGIYISHGRAVTGSTNINPAGAVRNRSSGFQTVSGPFPAHGFRGTSRSITGSFLATMGGGVQSFNQSVNTPFTGDTHAFNFSTGTDAYYPGVLCFPAGARSIDLAYMDSCLTQLQSSIAAALS